jgi:hypothetical protein
VPPFLTHPPRILETQDDFVQMKTSQILTVLLRFISSFPLAQCRLSSPPPAQSQHPSNSHNYNPFWTIYLYAYRRRLTISETWLYNVSRPFCPGMKFAKLSG